MKKTIITSIMFLAITFYAKAQSEQTLVDRFSVKAGLIGVWVGYEKAFSDHFTLNSEIGYEGDFFWGTSQNDDFNYIASLSFSVEPRYYYNVARRIRKGKKTRNNSANFISAEIYAVPDWLTSSNANNVTIVKTFGIVPKYGLNRSISEHLNFEFAIGAGYAWGEDNYSGVAAALDLRLSFDL
ncbi:MAG: DUF3575 domain-containing protein [Flavobacteriaceae bacterium]